MSEQKEALTVALGERAYPIYFDADWASRLVQCVAECSAVAVVADAALESEVRRLKASWQVPLLKCFVFEERGEGLKSLARYGELLNWLAAGRLDRSAAVVALGGGVVGDLAGFAAATYLRGVKFIQVPTTLLAMVDSSVGGKTGINLDAGKNLVGAFYQPQAVLIRTSFLETLSPREFSAGMAEVIKYGMLADGALFKTLEALDNLHPTHLELAGIIRRCCAIKADVVCADERETASSGGRALLNLGHTFAHAIERVAGYGTYLHGEAVGIGLVMAAALSERFGYIEQNDVERVRQLVARYALPVALQEPLEMEVLIEAMHHDKKTAHGKLRFVAMRAIGQAMTIDSVSEEWIRELWLAFGAQT